MRRKRQALALLIALLALTGAAIYLQLLGRWGIPIGWVVLVIGLIAASQILRCPKCGARLGSIFQNVCTSCGVLLSEKIVILPNQQGVDPAAAAYMTESRRRLQKWGRIRKKLRWFPLVAGVATTIGMLFLLTNEEMPGRIGASALIGLIAGGIGWLILTHVLDNAVGLAFMAFRGRCPMCRAWFNPPASFGPGSIDLDFSLPHFCASCGAKLG